MSASVAAALLEDVRQSAPLIQCITNSVVTNFTANALLALGAAPAMVDIVGEAGPFAGVASGLLINLGTPHPEQRTAAREAVDSAGAAQTPWVLDPVAIGSLPIRTPLAHELAAKRPSAIRGNASEILALAGSGTGGRGVETTDSIDEAALATHRLARGLDTVVAVSGPEDLITDGRSVARVANGDILLTKVTGGGCALGAIVTTFLAARGETSPLLAVTAAHAVYGVAAQKAAASAQGPGSFAVNLLDSLASLRPDEVAEMARIRVEQQGDVLA